MYVRIIKGIYNFNELKKLCWSGALETLETIEKKNKQKEFMIKLEEIYDLTYVGKDTVDITELNDFIWFEKDYIYEQLDIEYE